MRLPAFIPTPTRMSETQEYYSKCLVTQGPRLERRLSIHWAVGMFMPLGCLLAIINLSSLWSLPFCVVLGWWIGAVADYRFARARAYRNGWLDGRARMVTNRPKHVSEREWLAAEIDHDWVVVFDKPFEDSPARGFER